MSEPVRLCEVVASLSLATDLGLGLPQEHVLRQTEIAARLAELAGFDAGQRVDVLHVGLLAWVGCVADSHELAHWFGDDVALRASSYQVDKAGLPMVRFMLGQLAADTAWARVTLAGRFLGGGSSQVVGGFATHCQTTGDIADRLGLSGRVRTALGQAFERWDGKGAPEGLRGDQIDSVMRVVQIADDTEVFLRQGGVGAATRMLGDRRGTEFDPALVDLVLAHADDLLGDLGTDAWGQVIQRCRALDRPLADAELDEMLAVLADFADLKSPWWLGHSRAVADLASRAAVLAGLDEADVTVVRRAGLVHRLGAVGVSTGIWDKPTALTASEGERVRNVPHLTERVLARQPVLARIGALAGQLRERLDGSGYPRGLGADLLSPGARLLTAAQRYQALAEDRPHRSALSVAERRRSLEADVTAGRLDTAAVRAVLAAAGHRVGRRTTWVAGLTAREAEVLTLVARGWSNRQIGERLVISPRTVGSHIEHVYAKIGVSTRGAAAMFAMRHGIIDPGAD